MRKGLCNAFRRVYATLGVPNETSSDGGPEFIAAETLDFFQRWGTHHRLSSAYNPQSNGRAEVAVKAMKRLLEKNIGPDGNLNSDAIVRALLQVRNTPDRECKLSPAEILFGRRLRDATPQLDKNLMMFANPAIDDRWKTIWAAKETAIGYRAAEHNLRVGPTFKELQPLRVGDIVYIQNQNPSFGNPKKWDRQGKVVAAGQFDQYLVRVSGSGRLTLRNRQFLRKVPNPQHVPSIPRRIPTALQPEKIAPQSVLTESSTIPRCAPNVSLTPQHDVTDPQRLPAVVEPSDSVQSESVPVPAVIDIPLVTEGGLTTESRDTQQQSQQPQQQQQQQQQQQPEQHERPKRQRKQTLFYNADSGKEMLANDGGELL